MGHGGLKEIFLAITCSALLDTPLAGQTNPDTLEDRVEEVLESILENSTRDVEDSQYAETLIEMSKTPIDVNSATLSDLRQIPGVDLMLAQNIVSYREQHSFNSMDDLLLVKGMDRELFLQIRGFLVVETLTDVLDMPKPLSVRLTERVIRRLHDQQGFFDGAYAGNPYKIYNKIATRYAPDPSFYVQAGGLTEKDPGEKDVTDFASGFICVATKSNSMRCILGDYVIEAGQGLVLWRSAGTTKGSEVIASIAKNPRGLQPYGSSDENGYFRGVAVQASLSRFNVIAFISRKSINANLDEEGSISSFDLSGLSRTHSEIQTKSSSGERLIGVNAEARIVGELRMGVRGYTTRFDNPVALSTMNGFHGQRAAIGSGDFSFVSNRFGSFGEVAMDHARAIAAIGGFVVKPVPPLDVALVAHSYTQRFVSLHGFGFGEAGDQLQNGKGVYTSARLDLCAWLSISTYYDQFASVGASTLSLLPTYGNEFLSTVELQPNDKFSLQFQLKHKDQADEQNVLDAFSRTNSVLGRRSQANYRLSFEWCPSSFLRWRSRIEQVIVRYSPAATAASGVLLYQDIRLRPKARISVDGRVIVFGTDSYDSRIYEYESELRGTFANPALYGKGIRVYALARYEMGIFEISVKYSCTIKPGAAFLSSGESEIPGDTDNQLSFQIDLTL